MKQLTIQEISALPTAEKMALPWESVPGWGRWAKKGLRFVKAKTVADAHALLEKDTCGIGATTLWEISVVLSPIIYPPRPGLEVRLACLESEFKSTLALADTLAKKAELSALIKKFQQTLEQQD